VSEHPVVAGYGGLDCADAVQLGAMLAAAIDEPLIVANAYRYDPVALSARALPALDNERRAAASQRELRRARAFVRADIEIVEWALPAVDVAGALAGLAREADASILVLGRDTDGHVTRGLVPRAPCPVAVAPLSAPLPTGPHFERIGIAYDGSPSARWALDAAGALALLTGARLVLLAAASSAEQAATLLHIARLKVPESVDRETRRLVGDAAGTLAAASEDLDLLVCGSRGRSRPRAKIFGSVSAHLVAHALCPVLVVPPGVGYSPDGPLGLVAATSSCR
jgi:nucleotide-binding universal stress UspA family protein